MTALLKFYDASSPPVPPPEGFDGVCFYGGGDTPHVWTPAEVEAQPARYRLPVFVRSDPDEADAASDVVAFLAYLEWVGAPRGCLVALDSETSIDPAYVAAFVDGMQRGGYVTEDYGSQSTVAGNHARLVWGADWDGKPELAPGDVMTQYWALASIDEDVALASLPFWDTQAPPPAPADPWKEDDMPTAFVPGQREVWPVWADASAARESGAYSNVSLVLAGDTGAEFSVTWYFNGGHGEGETYSLESSATTMANPRSLDGVSTVAIKRTDSNTALAASAVLNRW